MALNNTIDRFAVSTYLLSAGARLDLTLRLHAENSHFGIDLTAGGSS